MLAILVVLADFLFYPHEPGVSLAIFGLALIVGVLTLDRPRLLRLRVLLLAAVAVAACLPLVEAANLLWWPLAMLAVSALALDASDQLPGFERWFGTFARFLVLGPVRLLGDGLGLLAEAGEQKLGGRVLRVALVWLVPVACAAVFAMLFVSANPVLALGVDSIRLDRLFSQIDPLRVFIWGFFAFVTWPVLVPRLLHWAPLPEVAGPSLPKAESLVFGATAIRNSLVVFNALFAIQTALDLLYLWGGVRLPSGITYAEYAHHAAYPLIVTAVLAGAFVLAAMRRDGPGRSSPLIRPLVYLWIAQNVWLVISSILRLKLYVEVYALSELRIAAGVWMVLVAAGLLLILVKIAFDRSNGWLIMANCVSLSLALYAVALLDFPAIISRYDVEHSAEVTGQGSALDLDYFRDLGPGTIPAIDQLLRTARFATADELKMFRLERDNLAQGKVNRDIDGTASVAPVAWQSWTWRDDRLRRYLAEQPFAPAPAAGHN